VDASFEHPPLFAAMGYGVLLPSMPQSETAMQMSNTCL
jgi:hypothetical protein